MIPHGNKTRGDIRLKNLPLTMGKVSLRCCMLYFIRKRRETSFQRIYTVKDIKERKIHEEIPSPLFFLRQYTDVQGSV